MPLSPDTKWTLGVGFTVLAALGWTVNHLTDLQIGMENRLNDNTNAAESRLSERIDKVDARLSALEDETATLAAVQAQLTQMTRTIADNQTRLSQALRETENRLTTRIDRIGERLLHVEGENAKLAALMQSNRDSTWPVWSTADRSDIHPLVREAIQTAVDHALQEAIETNGSLP